MFFTLFLILRDLQGLVSQVFWNGWRCYLGLLLRGQGQRPLQAASRIGFSQSQEGAAPGTAGAGQTGERASKTGPVQGHGCSSLNPLRVWEVQSLDIAGLLPCGHSAGI